MALIDLLAPFEDSRRHRRWMRMEVSPSALVEMWKHTDWLTIRISQDALPDDARCVGVVADNAAGILSLMIESDSFPPVPEGVTPMILRPPCFARWLGPGAPT